MGNITCKEVDLANKLKEICDEQGQETDIIKSADIFNQFGILFREKSPDKVSLIRSAVFYNAVLSRQPNNDEAKERLKELCSNVLILSKAELQDVNLIQISEQVQHKVIEMRKHSKDQLKGLVVIPVGLPEHELHQLKEQKISLIKNLQNDITNDFISIMKDISNKCVRIMGNPPCQHSIVGMGSLARREITPYSDFEHVIILEDGVQLRSDYDDVLEYFRWFTVIFQLIIVNLRETIIPSISVSSLNNSNVAEGDWFFDSHTTRGISFDGMMVYACKFPLGRTQTTKSKPWLTELIKPVSEMAKYLKVKEDIKNGYHLADILTRTCFVSGDKNVYDHFQSLTQVIMQSDPESCTKQILLQLNKDLGTYSAIRNSAVGTVMNWNIKRIIYRSTSLFVCGLGRLYAIEKHSCFDIIDELLKSSKLDPLVAQALSYAIAVACETRLKVYTAKGNQNDYIGERNFYANEHNVIKYLSELIGEQSLGDYFVTAASFQNAISAQGIDNKSFIDNNFRSYYKFAMFFRLDLRNLIFAEWSRYLQNPNKFGSNCNDSVIRYYVAFAYSRNGDFEIALKMYDELEEESKSSNLISKLEIMRRKANCLCESQHYLEGLEYISECLNKQSSILSFKHHQKGYLLALQGDCKRHLNMNKDAIRSYFTALEHIECSWSSFRKHLQAKCHFFIGQCQFNTGDFKDAICSAETSLAICKNSNIEISLVCTCNRLMGECYTNLDLPQKALDCFKKELHLRKKQTSSEQSKNDDEISIVSFLIHATELKLKSG